MLKRLTLGLLAATTMLLPVAALTSTAAAGTRGHPPVHVINLTAAYHQALPHAKAGRKIILPPLRKHTKASQHTTCTEPDHCNLVYGGGPVQHSVHLYLLLWGPNWSTDTSQEASASYLESFYQGLGVEPQDNWSTITSQYGDGSGFPTFNGSVYEGAFQDTSTPPSGVTQTQLTAEADAFATTHSIASGDTDAQIVIATQSGTCPQGFAGSTCGGTPSYCAWHSATDTSIPFTNLPYILDAGASCGEDFVNSNGTDDGFSIVGGHEYAETITDPYPTSGWFDPNDNISGGEIGDKCAWGGGNWGGSDPSGNVTLSTGSFAMQSLYSNAANGCVMSAPSSDQVTITNPGTQSGTVSNSASLQIQASSSTGATLSYGAAGLPPSLSINSSTGLITGTLTQAGSFSVNLTVTDSAGGSANASFTWNVSPSSSSGPIEGDHSKCVRANASQTHPELYTCGRSRETWQFAPGGALQLSGGRCIAYQSSTRELVLSNCSSGDAAQEWNRISSQQYQNHEANVCMTDPSGASANGTQLVGRSCQGFKDQMWSLP